VPPGANLSSQKIFCDTWVPIVITHIMNFGIQATLMAELVLCDIYKVILITYTIKLWSSLGDLKNGKSWIFFSLGEVLMGIGMGLGVIAIFMLPLWPPELILSSIFIVIINKWNFEALAPPRCKPEWVKKILWYLGTYSHHIYYEFWDSSHPYGLQN